MPVPAPNRPRHWSRSRRYEPNYDRNDGRPGVVYVLHNEAFRLGLYKIGQSTRSGAHRALDMNRTVGTETPKMFVCVFEATTVDCGRAEKAIHQRLDAFRLTKQEYFEVDLELAKQVILEECAKQTPATVAQSNQRTQRGQRHENSQIKPPFLIELEIKNSVSNARWAWMRSVKQRYKFRWSIKALQVALVLGLLSAAVLWLGAFIHFMWMNIGLIALVMAITFEVAWDSQFSKYLRTADAAQKLKEIEDEVRNSGSVQVKPNVLRSHQPAKEDSVLSQAASPLTDIMVSPSANASPIPSPGIASTLVVNQEIFQAKIEQALVDMSLKGEGVQPLPGVDKIVAQVLLNRYNRQERERNASTLPEPMEPPDKVVVSKRVEERTLNLSATDSPEIPIAPASALKQPSKRAVEIAAQILLNQHNRDKCYV